MASLAEFDSPAARPLMPPETPNSEPSPEVIAVSSPPIDEPRPSLRIYSHSPLVYWWSVWVTGYAMAALVYWRGERVTVGPYEEMFYPGSNPGVLFLLILTFVILITNVSVRGMASALVVMGAALISVVLAYFGWWDEVLGFFGNLKVQLSLGAYFWFSTLMFLIWAISTFVVDRMSYLEVTPGQVSSEVVLGAGTRSYDTNGMMLEKHQEDIFRHWLLGLGSGDLQIRTTGATRETIEVPNVLFIASKITAMQRLIAVEPGATEAS